jgi:hypothetical protein
MQSLKEAFPEPFFNHAAAVKANPLRYTAVKKEYFVLRNNKFIN